MSILRAASLCLLSYVFFAVFRFSVGLFLPELSIEFGLTSIEAGVFASAPMLASAMTMALAGYASDRVGRKIVLAVGYTVLSASIFLTSIAQKYLISLTFILLAGVGAGLIPPTIYAWMGSLRPQSRGFMVGITAGVYNFGGFIGSWIFGSAVATYGWRITVSYLAISGFICMLMIWVFLGTVPKPVSSRGVVSIEGLRYSELLKSRHTIFASLSMFFGVLAQFVIMTWTPAFLRVVGRIDIASIGLIIGLYSIAGGIGAILSGSLASFVGEKRLIFCTGMVSAMISFLMYTHNLTFVTTAILISLLGLTHFPFWNLITSLVQNSVNFSLIGSITGIVQNLGIVGGFIGPLMTGALVIAFPFTQVMVMSVSLPLLAYALLILPYRGKRKV